MNDISWGEGLIYALLFLVLAAGLTAYLTLPSMFA